MTLYTLFGQPATAGTIVADTAVYTMGVQFSVSQAGTLTAIWWDSPSGASVLPSQIALFAVSGGSLVHAEAAVWSGAAASGWVRAAFSSPPALAAGTAYKAAIFGGGGGSMYGDTPHYWDTGPGSGGITNGPLSAPNAAGSAQGQDTFDTTGSLAYPATQFNETNYWLDPEVSVIPAAVVTRQQQQSGRTMLRKRLLYADL